MEIYQEGIKTNIIYIQKWFIHIYFKRHTEVT